MFIATNYEINIIKDTEERFKRFCYFIENCIINDKYSCGSNRYEFRKGQGMFDGYITYKEIPVFYFNFYTKRFEILNIRNDVRNFAYFMLENTSFEAEKRAGCASLFSYLKKECKIKDRIISENQKEIMKVINLYTNYALLASEIFFAGLEEFSGKKTEGLLRKIDVTNQDIEVAFKNIDLNKFTVEDSNITKDIVDYLYKILI